jgi:hypothetical protein
VAHCARSGGRWLMCRPFRTRNWQAVAQVALLQPGARARTRIAWRKRRFRRCRLPARAAGPRRPHCPLRSSACHAPPPSLEAAPRRLPAGRRGLGRSRNRPDRRSSRSYSSGAGRARWRARLRVRRLHAPGRTAVEDAWLEARAGPATCGRYVRLISATGYGIVRPPRFRTLLSSEPSNSSGRRKAAERSGAALANVNGHTREGSAAEDADTGRTAGAAGDITPPLLVSAILVVKEVAL